MMVNSIIFNRKQSTGCRIEICATSYSWTSFTLGKTLVSLRYVPDIEITIILTF